MIDKNNQGIIDINVKATPAILASMLGINVSMTYQGRQDGKLPPNPSASYRECIIHYINFWKGKSASKVSNVSEKALLQKIELDRAKTENEWLNNKEKKKELIGIKEFAEVCEPVFLQIRTQLISISRKHPETQETIDRCLEEWYRLGERMEVTAQTDLDNFISEKMEVIDDIEEEDIPLSTFDDYVSPVLQEYDDLL